MVFGTERAKVGPDSRACCDAIDVQFIALKIVSNVLEIDVFMAAPFQNQRHSRCRSACKHLPKSNGLAIRIRGFQNLQRYIPPSRTQLRRTR